MARTITLALLGGGVVLGGAAMLSGPSTGAAQDHQPCEEARQQARPDTEQICASARSATHHGIGPLLWIGGTGGPRGPALASAGGFRTPAPSARGGFGSAARSFFSSSDSAGS